MSTPTREVKRGGILQASEYKGYVHLEVDVGQGNYEALMIWKIPIEDWKSVVAYLAGA